MNPGRLADDVVALRKEVENLRVALGVKVATYVRTLGLARGDVLVVTPPKGVSIPPEALEHTAKMLRDRLGWDVPVLVEGQATVGKAGGTDAKS